tara:strand:- start:727 stop:1113 length:387 start_codon:yes stop_codon:yes gene_type:complete
MFKSTIAAVVAAPFVLSTAAIAGPYVNVEANASYPDGDYSGATTDIHVGYEGQTEGGLAYYVQGGPALVHSEAADDTDTELSGKVGASYGVTPATDVYGEISGISNGEDADGDNIINWGAKIGAKWNF